MEVRKFLPLFRYLFLHTETHAFCGSLAFFAFLTFYPFSFMLLSFTKYAMKWEIAYIFITDTLREYYPISQDFLIRNLGASVHKYGDHLQVDSVFWVILGAAGIFIPTETALNKVWELGQSRPYWKNQLVGFFVTTACFLMAIVFVVATTMLQSMIRWVMPGLLEEALSYLAFKLAAICFTSSIIFLFYKFLPNGEVRGKDVLPAAVVAGFVGELVRNVYFFLLPYLNFEKTQGPYYVSVSFLLFAYVEAFVFLGGAYLAKDLLPRSWVRNVWPVTRGQ